MNPRRDLAVLAARHALPTPLRGTRGMQRLNAILDLADPKTFVQELASQELYLLMHDIGRSDAYVLIEHASEEQLEELIAIDVWHRDNVQLERWLGWLDLANACGHHVALRFIKSTDAQLLQLLLSGDIRVHGKDLDIDTVPDHLQLISSPDLMFKFTVPREHPLEERLSELLKLLWAQDPDRMRTICTATQFELRAQLQESLYGFRNGRLEDMGLCSTEHAAEIYELINPKSLRNQIRQSLDEMATIRPFAAGTTGFDLILTGAEAPDFLAEALAHVDDDTRALFGEAFAHLASKVFVARTGDHSHLTELPDATQYAAKLVGLGLAYVTDERVDVASNALGRVWPEQLFRAGHSLTMELGLKARRLRRRSGLNRGLFPFGSPGDDLINELAAPQPMFFAGLERDGGTSARPFSTLGELALAKVHVDGLDVVLTFFEESLGFSPDALLSLDGVSADVLRTTRLASLFRTGLAQLVLTDAFAFVPLTRSDLAAFLTAALEGPTELSAPVREACEALATHAAPEVGDWIERTMDELVLALGRVTANEIDPRYAAELFLVRDEDG